MYITTKNINVNNPRDTVSVYHVNVFKSNITTTNVIITIANDLVT